jgi:hypothetical protein
LTITVITITSTNPQKLDRLNFVDNADKVKIIITTAYPKKLLIDIVNKSDRVSVRADSMITPNL